MPLPRGSGSPLSRCSRLIVLSRHIQDPSAPECGRAFCRRTRCSHLSVIRISCSCFAPFCGAGKGIQWVTSHCIKGPEGVIQRSLSKEVRRINSDLKGSGSGSFISMAITISPSDGFCCLASIHLFIYDSFLVHALG